MVEHQEFLKVFFAPRSELVYDMRLTLMETEAWLRAGDRLVRVFVQLFAFSLF